MIMLLAGLQSIHFLQFPAFLLTNTISDLQGDELGFIISWSNNSNIDTYTGSKELITVHLNLV